MPPTLPPIPVGPLRIHFKIDPGAAGGAVSVFEVEVPAGAKVPAPHSHDDFEETVYGLDGTSAWTVDGATVEVGPGEALHIPRGAVHGFANAGAGDVRFLSVVTPGRLGPGYFRELGEVLAAGGPPDPAAIGAVMRRHGLTPAVPVNA